MTIQDVLLNGGEMTGGCSWTDRWLGNNKIERIGTFGIEGMKGAKEIEFKAIITLGKIHPVRE